MVGCVLSQYPRSSTLLAVEKAGECRPPRALSYTETTVVVWLFNPFTANCWPLEVVGQTVRHKIQVVEI